MTGISFARTDTSILGRWWWTVDRLTLGAVMLLMGIGIWLTLSASPSVAERIGAGSLHFVHRQMAFAPLTLLIILAVSLIKPVSVRRLAVVGFIASAVLMVLTLFFGPEVKGATRWLMVGGFSLQPSEFIKPTFAVVAAWMFAEHRRQQGFPGNHIAIGLFLLVVALLLLQPDVGMTFVVTVVWGVQFFLAGLPMAFVFILGVAGLALLVVAYFTFDHVASRVDRFLDPSSGDSYQVRKAMEAFHNGGLTGTGPGEGSVKLDLPDAHTDFVFAVAGEEFGVFLCLGLVALFAFIMLRGFARLFHESNMFVMLAACGLLVQFALQAIINMASTLHLMPTKGMTLPFISYGGSSMLGLGLGMGMVLALTRTRMDDGGLS
ncbi:MAG: cell division protein FtsW [Alphaproteobacteria bacterium RIFOXYD12_FULL_60_8]|nr:MAG: cell division protein FtsW [Alphaproteobacteria bacterium RIFOXYD12_FULL_60_8]